MGLPQWEQAGAGWGLGGGSRELYVISSASSPAYGGGGGVGTPPGREPGTQVLVW